MNALTYLHLKSGQTLPELQHSPFRALVVVQETVSNEWGNLVSDWLVRNGCLYMLAWGEDCGAWDDSVDWASIAADDFEDVPDDKFVMTTWHEHEPLSETMWFASHWASHPTVNLEHTFIVHIAPQARRDELLELYRAAEAA